MLTAAFLTEFGEIRVTRFDEHPAGQDFGLAIFDGYALTAVDGQGFFRDLDGYKMHVEWPVGPGFQARLSPDFRRPAVSAIVSQVDRPHYN